MAEDKQIELELDDNNDTKLMNIDGQIKSVSVINISKPYRFDIGYEYADKNIGSDFSFDVFFLFFLLHA